MPACYYLTNKGRSQDPANPTGKLVMDYCKEGHCPVNADEIKQMVPNVPNPSEELESLTRAGFLKKESEENQPTYGFVS